MSTKILISIDDTDEIGTMGTGEILELMLKEVSSKFDSQWSAVTRHQLFISDEIAYTSHNSSMCSIGDVSESANVLELITLCEEYLKQVSAPKSDPGLCIIELAKFSTEQTEILINYGKKAKVEVITKENAYSLARELGIYLEEHGGEGIGVIGALAGAGLRLSKGCLRAVVMLFRHCLRAVLGCFCDLLMLFGCCFEAF